MTFLAKPSVAVGFGAFIVCAETCDHWHAIAGLSWLNMPLHDWTAGLLLMAVPVVRGRAYQAAAWAFMLSLLVGAFFGHLELFLGPPEPDATIPERIVFPVLVVLNLIALLSLIGTLWPRRTT